MRPLGTVSCSVAAKGLVTLRSGPPVGSPMDIRAKASGHEPSSKARPMAAALVSGGTAVRLKSSRSTRSRLGSATTAEGESAARRATISEVASAPTPRIGSDVKYGPLRRRASTPAVDPKGPPMEPERHSDSLAAVPPATPSMSTRPAMLRYPPVPSKSHAA